jgi:hypothetical protein
VEDWNFFIIFEFENRFFPDFLNVVQFNFDLSFLSSSVNNFINFFGEFEKIKFNQVLEAERRSFVVNSLSGNDLKFFSNVYPS